MWVIAVWWMNGMAINRCCQTDPKSILLAPHKNHQCLHTTCKQGFCQLGYMIWYYCRNGPKISHPVVTVREGCSVGRGRHDTHLRSCSSVRKGSWCLIHPHELGSMWCTIAYFLVDIQYTQLIDVNAQHHQANPIYWPQDFYGQLRNLLVIPPASLMGTQVDQANCIGACCHSKTESGLRPWQCTTLQEFSGRNRPLGCCRSCNCPVWYWVGVGLWSLGYYPI